MKSRLQSPYAILGLVLVLMILIILPQNIFSRSIFVSSLSTNNSNGDNDNLYEYAIIIDAGSTGSRVHIYRYKAPSSPSSLIDIDYEHEKYKKFTPGLSSHESNPTDAGKSLEPLLSYIRENVPYKYRSTTPLYLLATAGMRKVYERSPTAADTILSSCYHYLKEHSEFIVKESWIKIIGGQDEGLWGWITANYLNGAIKLAVENGSPYHMDQGNRHHHTYGVLEMGGESLQITFIPNEDILNDIKDKIILKKIGGITFPIFTYSFMGIGMQAAQNKYDTYLITKKNERESSCYLKGDKKEKSIGSKIIWDGNGNYDDCYNDLAQLINKNECFDELQHELESELNIKKKLSCGVDGITFPYISDSHKFYYIENFYYTAQVLGIHDVKGADGFLSVLKDHGRSYCQLTKEEAITKFSKATSDEISKSCFCSAWLSVILEKGFDLEDFTAFEVIRDINNVGIDWALGFLVEQSQEIEETKRHPIVYGMIIVIILILLWYFYKNFNTTIRMAYKKTNEKWNKYKNYHLLNTHEYNV